MKKVSHDINLARENLTTAMTRIETWHSYILFRRNVAIATTRNWSWQYFFMRNVTISMTRSRSWQYFLQEECHHSYDKKLIMTIFSLGAISPLLWQEADHCNIFFRRNVTIAMTRSATHPTPQSIPTSRYIDLKSVMRERERER